MILPPKPPSSGDGLNTNSYAEHFAELLKAISSISDINHQPSIEKFTYTMPISTANTYALEATSATNINSSSFFS